MSDETKKGWFTKLFGNAVQSKKFRVLLSGFLGMVLTAAAAKYDFIDPTWADKLAEYILYGVGAFVGLQGVTDIASGGTTSSSHPENN